MQIPFQTIKINDKTDRSDWHLAILSVSTTHSMPGTMRKRPDRETIRARLNLSVGGSYLPAFDPIMNVPTLWNGTSRVPIGVRTSTVPSAR